MTDIHVKMPIPEATALAAELRSIIEGTIRATPHTKEFLDLLLAVLPTKEA